MKKKPWMPKVLSEYEVAKSLSAIDAVELLDKPIAEVMGRKVSKAHLRSDLKNILKLAGNRSKVKYWIRSSERGRLRYGFYIYPWTLKALDFLDSAKLRRFDRDWIAGRLYGYRPGKIQEFLDRKKAKN